MARLTLTLLGGFRARLDSGVSLALPTRKAQALLAYLAVPAGTAHPRDKLASLLWGGTMETTARTSLRQTLYALRKSLQEANPAPLLLEADTVALDPAAVTVDVRTFEQGVSEVTPVALMEALGLYEGDFLDGLTVQEPPFEDWLQRERERLREMASGSCATPRPSAVDGLDRRGDPDGPANPRARPTARGRSPGVDEPLRRHGTARSGPASVSGLRDDAPARAPGGTRSGDEDPLPGDLASAQPQSFGLGGTADARRPGDASRGSVARSPGAAKPR